ncbi:MAG: peptidyl-prolyl cis-trans isomerase, partial [Verrucomicrobiota bacterium]
MMITKFQRLIGSKIFWGVFIFVISVLFSFTFIPNTDGMNPFGFGKESNDAGVLNGKVVSYPKYSATRRKVSTINNLFSQRLTDRELENRTWQRIASHHLADKLDLPVGRNDLVNSIRQNFSGPRGYSPQAYNNFIAQQFSGQTNAFEALWADFLVESQLRNTAAEQFLLAPSEIKELYHTVKDQFTVDYVILERDQAGEVSVSDEELASYYEDHKEEFKTPEERTASYLAIAVSNFMAAAETEITDEAIQTYYDLNIGQFTVTDKVVKAATEIDTTNTVDAATNTVDNAVNPAASATNTVEAATNVIAATTNDLADASNSTAIATNELAALTNTVETPPPEEIGEIRIIPLEEARPGILATLSRVNALKKAAYQADRIFADTIPRGGNPAKDLAQIAQAENLRLSTTGYIRVGAILPQVDMEAFFDFNQAVFELNLAEGENISAPILGSNHVYLVRLDGIQPPAVPSLAEVKESMYIQAEKFYIGQALTEKAKTIRDT